MTLIIAWIGVDQKKEGKSIASLYIASDSRYTWGGTKPFNNGIKLHGSANYPEIFGICGDVTFPTTVLSQLVLQIDSHVILNQSDSGSQKNHKVFDFIETSLNGYPKDKLKESFTILHGTRTGQEFKLFKTSFNLNSGLKNEEIELPKFSTTVFSGGSGSSEFETNWLKLKNVNHNEYRTSRGVYQCLSQTLKEIKDNRTGGMPQIIGLYRIDNSRIFGIIENDKKYVLGKESAEGIITNRIEWRNELFERMNPKSMKIIEGAQRQPS